MAADTFATPMHRVSVRGDAEQDSILLSNDRDIGSLVLVLFAVVRVLYESTCIVYSTDYVCFYMVDHAIVVVLLD